MRCLQTSRAGCSGQYSAERSSCTATRTTPLGVAHRPSLGSSSPAAATQGQCKRHRLIASKAATLGEARTSSDTAESAQPHAASSQDASQSQTGEFSKLIQAAAQHLAEHGWAVVPGVLSAHECKQYTDGVWRWLGGLGDNISPSDPSSWGAEERGWPPSFKGIINTMEVAHQDFVWQVRKHPRLVQVFAELYGTNELLTSFDSINLTPPGTDLSGGWLHVDHAPLKKGNQCIQGIMNLVDVGPDTTGTLLVKDRSNQALEDFYEHHTHLTPQQKAETGDWYVFQESELPFWENLRSLGLPAKAGDLFLWDSRTAHQNIGPKATSAWRHVVYVCYQPRSLATDHDLGLKRQAWDEHLVTTHWPAANVTVFPALGKSYYKLTPGETDSSSDQHDAAPPAPPGYWEKRVADGSAQRLLTSLRNRDNVEDAAVRKLAGVQPYDFEEVWQTEPLVQMGTWPARP